MKRMLEGDNIKVKFVRRLPYGELERVADFLQGAVYCWCRNRGDEWFTVQSLLGGMDGSWLHTPLLLLYKRQARRGLAREAALRQASVDVGRILKRVLANDARRFVTRPGRSRSYRWVK